MSALLHPQIQWYYDSQRQQEYGYVEQYQEQGASGSYNTPMETLIEGSEEGMTSRTDSAVLPPATSAENQAGEAYGHAEMHGGEFHAGGEEAADVADDGAGDGYGPDEMFGVGIDLGGGMDLGAGIGLDDGEPGEDGWAAAADAAADDEDEAGAVDAPQPFWAQAAGVDAGAAVGPLVQPQVAAPQIHLHHIQAPAAVVRIFLVIVSNPEFSRGIPGVGAWVKYFAVNLM